MRLGITRTLIFGTAGLGLACIVAASTPGPRRRATAAGPLTDSPPSKQQEPAVMPGRRHKRRWTFLATLVLGAVIAGVAVGAWTISGSGSGYAKAGVATGLTLNDASGATVADLYPGVTGTVKLNVTNPNAFPVRITNVTGTGAITSDKGAACNAATGVTFTNQTGLTLDLAAGATSAFTLSGAAAMSNSSDNTCQGAVFTIPVSVSGVSNG
jgi:hypothetical protein